jgi:hypothetical protein
MHVPEKHEFDDILDSGLKPMGRDGGFRIVVFQGQGYVKNEGALGEDNWRCSGRKMEQSGDGVCVFDRVVDGQKVSATAMTLEDSSWQMVFGWVVSLFGGVFSLLAWVLSQLGRVF